MSKVIWTQEQVDSLNRRQASTHFHPYTCGGNRTDKNHLDGEGILVATPEGWVCPYCDYTQDWANDYDVSGKWGSLEASLTAFESGYRLPKCKR